MEYIVRTLDICKKYKSHKALDGVCMNVARGDIYGFVGENGSGKTTIIRVITGLIFPDSGAFELFGISHTSPNILKARARIGAIVESPSIYLNMTAYENLKMQCGVLGINSEDKIKEALELVGLGYLYNDNKKAGNFSLGMRQRLGIAMALISSLTDKKIPDSLIAIGEIGLAGEIRSVSNASLRVAEAARLGFTRILLP